MTLYYEHLPLCELIFKGFSFVAPHFKRPPPLTSHRTAPLHIEWLFAASLSPPSGCPGSRPCFPPLNFLRTPQIPLYFSPSLFHFFAWTVSLAFVLSHCRNPCLGQSLHFLFYLGLCSIGFPEKRVLWNLYFFFLWFSILISLAPPRHFMLQVSQKPTPVARPLSTSGFWALSFCPRIFAHANAMGMFLVPMMCGTCIRPLSQSMGRLTRLLEKGVDIVLFPFPPPLFRILGLAQLPP